MWHFHKACEAAGVHGLWIHDTRRSFITRKLAEGWDYKRIMLITGHKSLYVFNRYNQPSFEDLRAVVSGRSGLRSRQNPNIVPTQRISSGRSQTKSELSV